MRLYYLSGAGNLHTAQSIKWTWDVENNPNVPVYVHPELDFYWIAGECLLRNKIVNFIKLEPGSLVSDVSGPCYFLAEHGHKAEQLLYRTK